MSARNYAAGSRQKNASDVIGRGLCFVVHDVVGGSDDYSERRSKAEKWGFEVAAPSCRSRWMMMYLRMLYRTPQACAEKLAAYHASLGEQRPPPAVAGTPSSKKDELPYEIDGVVFKVDAAKADAQAGCTAQSAARAWPSSSIGMLLSLLQLSPGCGDRRRAAWCVNTDR